MQDEKTDGSEYVEYIVVRQVTKDGNSVEPLRGLQLKPGTTLDDIITTTKNQEVVLVHSMTLAREDKDGNVLSVLTALTPSLSNTKTDMPSTTTENSEDEKASEKNQAG